MADQGLWLGKWPGEWFGSLSTDPNLMAAALSGGSSINASLTYVSASAGPGDLIAALSGSSSVSATLSFYQQSSGGIVSTGEDRKKAFRNNTPVG